jgi:ubiquinone/menaquinone biosynthesis C-methylase UbiE
MHQMLLILFLFALGTTVTALDCLHVNGENNVNEVCCPAHTHIRAPDMDMSEKYDAESQACHGYQDSWTLLSEADHVRITHTIFEEMKVKPDDQVFEWGTGCGTKLRYLEDYYNASGMGIDMSPNSLRYAINNTERSVFCLANGKVLGWIPDRAFDQVFSFAALYLLGTIVKDISESKLCVVLAELVRITKTDGKIIVAGNLAGVHLPEAYFQRCYKRFLWKKYPHALSMHVKRDFQWFPPSLKHVFGKNGPYFKSSSVIMKRMA